MCVSCRKMHDKSSLIRVVKFDKKIELDKTGKKDGRGAYICKLYDCINKCIKTRGFNRAFKMQVEQEVYDRLGQLKP